MSGMKSACRMDSVWDQHVGRSTNVIRCTRTAPCAGFSCGVTLRTSPALCLGTISLLPDFTLTWPKYLTLSMQNVWPPLRKQVKVRWDLMHNSLNHSSWCATCAWQEAQLWDHTSDPITPRCWCRQNLIPGSPCSGSPTHPSWDSPKWQKCPMHPWS